MLKYRAFINHYNEKTSNDRVSIREEQCSNNVVAVFVDAMVRPEYGTGEKNTIHPDKGVHIEITPEVSVKKLMANYRCTEFWCKPSFVENMADIPDETQLLIGELENGDFITIVPVVNEKYKNIISGKSQDTLVVRAFSWCDTLYKCQGLSFVYSIGKKPDLMVGNCVREALKILNNGTRHIEQRRYPEVFEYLGWCSWDSMQIRVSQDGIIEKCEELRDKNIPVKWAIIDDMWAEVREFYDQKYDNFDEMIDLMYSSTMYDFEADPKRFPDGLKGCIDKMKEFGLKVGVWHPTTGYWSGITPNGEAYKKLCGYLMETEGNMLVPDWHTEKAYMYYKTMHDHFSKSGADFIKIDNQTMIRRFYKGLAPVGQIAKEFHDGMEASVGEHFDNAMINCMGLGSEDIWSRRISPVSRCSDDFQPDNKEWFVKHILQCAYNSVLLGKFYWCDWDMWWTDDGQAKKNSLMRAISGGPVYVSDKIGRSNADILKPLTLDDGRILRCDRLCVPTTDCMVEDCSQNGRALKLQNMAGEHGIMAVLNIDEAQKVVTAKISGSDIDGFEAEEYAVYEHFTHDFRILKKGESFEIKLDSHDEYKLYIFAPIKDGFAVIGRTDKFISPKTIEYVHGKEIKLLEPGKYAYVEGGKLIEKD